MFDVMIDTALLLVFSAYSGSLPWTRGCCSSGEVSCSYSMHKCKSLIYHSAYSCVGLSVVSVPCSHCVALFAVCSHLHLNCLSLSQLLKESAAPDARNGDWRTPLHLAVQGRSRLTVALLIQHGCSVSASDIEGASALSLACQVNKTDTTEEDCDADDVCGTGVCATAHAVVATLVHTGHADVNHTDDFGRSPLHNASAAGIVSIIDTLIACGADVDARDSQHHTPLFYACRYVLVLLSFYLTILRKPFLF
jgi:Ankyrin repeats (3 copies)/Ankyrin repeat